MSGSAELTGLVLGQDGATLEAYRASGGAPALGDPAAVRRRSEESDLRGRGGAGFPTARKLAAVAEHDGRRVVVVNGEEGEPTSLKDRWLLRNRPHLVVDGVRVAAHAVGAVRAVLYLSDPRAAGVVREALAQWPDLDPAVEVVEVAPGYVAGEETSIVSFLGGGEAKPFMKPPRPFEKGVDGQPTLVLNVETASRLALSMRPDVGASAADTMLATVQSAGRTRLVEAARGSTVRALLGAGETATPGPDPYAVIVGGFAGGIWPAAHVLDLPATFDAFTALGGVWGCGAVIALDADQCAVAAVLDIAGYLRRSSARQCGACVRGTEMMHVLLGKIARGEGGEAEMTQLLARAENVVGRGNCAMPDAAALMVTTLVRNFPDLVAAHLEHGCDECRAVEMGRGDDHPATRFVVDIDDCGPPVLLAPG